MPLAPHRDARAFDDRADEPRGSCASWVRVTRGGAVDAGIDDDRGGIDRLSTDECRGRDDEEDRKRDGRRTLDGVSPGAQPPHSIAARLRDVVIFAASWPATSGHAIAPRASDVDCGAAAIRIGADRGLIGAPSHLYDRPVPLRVDCNDRGWVVVYGSGCLTIDEMVNLIRTVRAEIAQRMTPMLVDARDATTSATDEDMQRAVAAVREAKAQGPRGHVAIVAPDDVLYARMLLYEAGCADAGVRVIRVFRQRADAERWLDIVSAARHFR
jgi:hypothetical protein